jgi:hypothetical protein
MFAFLARVAAFARSIPWQIWAGVGLLIAAYGYGCVQYDKGWDEGRAELEAEYREALAKATRKAQEAKEAEEAALAKLAEETDNAVEQELRSELDRARDFIRRNRVQPCPRGAASGPTTPAEDRSPGDDAGAGEAPIVDETATGVDLLPDADEGFVVVPSTDVLICTEAVIKAEAWREWGLELEARNK